MRCAARNLVLLLLAATVARGRHHDHRHHHRGFRYRVSSAAAASQGVAFSAASASSNSVPAGGGPASSDAKAVVYISKLKPGRHVCSHHKEVTQTISKREPYSKRTYKTYTQPCENNQVCHGVRAVYHTAYRTVYDTQPTRQTSFYCCPGWAQVNKFSAGCSIAVCAVMCGNGGSCVRPDTCVCPPGYTGASCDTDIDECEEKPCDQMCINTPGSFQCQCREGFTLLEDGRSCRSEGKIATEARDLNEVEILAKRVQKLEQETILETPSEAFIELNKKIETITDRVQILKNQLNSILREQEEQRRMLEQMRHSEPVIQRIAPLCKQVSVIQQKLDQCHCRSSYWDTIIS